MSKRSFSLSRVNFTVTRAVLGIVLPALSACTDPPRTSAIVTLPFTKQLGVAGKTTNGVGVATDTSGAIYIAGTTNGAFDGITLIGQQDIFVTKYDAGGTKQWTKHVGAPSPYSASAVGIAVFNVSATAANIYVGGQTNGGISPNSVTGTQDFTLTKLDQSGAIAWTKQFGAGSVVAQPAGVAVDANEKIYVAGYTSGNLAGTGLTGASDLFVAQYNSAGTQAWIKQLGVASATTTVYRVAANVTNGVYVVGGTNGNLDGQVKTGTSDAFIVNYNSAGTKVGTVLLGQAGGLTTAIAVAVDAATGAVFIAGSTTAGLSTNAQSGSVDMFTARYSSALVGAWVKQVGAGGTSTVSANSISLDSALNAYVSGSADAAFDGNTRTGVKDLIVAKFDASGTKQFTKQFGISSRTLSSAASALDASGNLFATGSADGGIDGWPQTGVQDVFLIKYNSSGAKL